MQIVQYLHLKSIFSFWAMNPGNGDYNRFEQPLKLFNKLFMRYLIPVYSWKTICETVKAEVKCVMKVVSGPSIHL